MDAREQQGLEIAALSKVKKNGAGWLVPSQTGTGVYQGELGLLGVVNTPLTNP